MTGNQPYPTRQLFIESIAADVLSRLDAIQFVKDHHSIAAIHQKNPLLKALFRDCPPIRLGQPLITAQSQDDENITALDEQLTETKKHVFRLLPSVVNNRLKRQERLLQQLYQQYQVDSPSTLIQAAYPKAPHYIQCQLAMQLLASMYFANVLNPKQKQSLADIYFNALSNEQKDAAFSLLDAVLTDFSRLKESFL